MSLAGCGGSRADPAGDEPSVMPPLASFASLRMITLPAQTLRRADSLGWSAQVGEPRRFLGAIDSTFAAQMRDRGLGTSWAFPDDLARTARRNPVYATDPATIRAGDAVRAMQRQRDAQIPEPVATQLRVLAGFHDTRHAVVPVEVRFERGTSAGTGRAVLRVAVLDVRASRIVFTGDVAGREANAYAHDLAIDLAQRFADLIVAR